MAGLNISLGNNVQDLIELYWSIGDSTIDHFRMYHATAVAGPFVLWETRIPNYPSHWVQRMAVAFNVSRTALGITQNVPHFFRITEVTKLGVESALIDSPTRAIPAPGASRFQLDVDINVAAYPINPQFNFGFAASSFVLVNKTGTGEIFYSFDGHATHGALGTMGTPDNSKIFDFRREHKVWCRHDGLDQLVRVEAWANWLRTL